jgi:tartrate dehydratase alpha subunit/fumarate hydratase class I-like protein
VCRVKGEGFRVYELPRSRVYSVGFGVQGVGCRVSALTAQVESCYRGIVNSDTDLKNPR